MSKTMTPQEILRDMVWEGSDHTDREEALSKLREWVLKKKKFPNYAGGGDLNWACSESEKKGYNQALEDLARELK